MWTVGGSNEEGKELVGILVHEIGHSLGIAHSEVKDAVMYDYYSEHMRNDKDFQLHEDDIKAVQTYYGRPWRKRVVIPHQLRVVKDLFLLFCSSKF